MAWDRLRCATPAACRRSRLRREALGARATESCTAARWGVPISGYHCWCSRDEEEEEEEDADAVAVAAADAATRSSDPSGTSALPISSSAGSGTASAAKVAAYWRV